MRRTMGIFALICTILISSALKGSIEMIINTSSLVIVLGIYSAGILISNIKLDDFIGEVYKENRNEDLISRFREITKMAAILSIIVSVAINGLNLIYNLTNYSSVGEAGAGILVTLLYVAIIQSVINAIFYTKVEK